MIDSTTLFLPVRELSARIRTKKLSPVELTTLCLERLETLGPKYNAVVTVMRESAMTAVSLVRTYARQLGLDPKLFTESDIHIHIPAGGMPNSI